MRPDQESLIAANMDFAHALARKYARREDDPEEVRADAYFGLTKAANRFNPKLGHEFRTYAWWVIRGEIRRGRRDRSWLNRPQWESNNVSAYPVRLDEPIPGKEDVTLEDELAALTVDPLAGVVIDDMMGDLPVRQRRAFRMAAFGLTQVEIASALGISQMQVSRDLKKARTQLHALAAESGESRFDIAQLV